MIRLLGPQGACRYHLSEDVLTRAITRELSAVRGFFANRHLDRCKECRARFEFHARTLRAIVEFRQNSVDRIGLLSSTRRDLFIRQLDARLESVPARPWWTQLSAQRNVQPFRNSVPSLTKALIAACAGLVLFLVWRSQPRSVSAAEFLNRATASDQSSLKNAGSGVIRRRFRIETANKVIERDAYHVVSGRRLQSGNVNAEDAELSMRLALAGVSWDDPLSAASFKSWHDRQQNSHDEIQSFAEGLLTITTRLQSTGIAQESLTVRLDGFHPVERTIEYREFGAVDISEAGLDFLSWESASRLFPEPELTYSTAPRRAPIHTLLPSAAQIDETELEARLILSQENADTGEQIEIMRDVKGVQVQGLVESDGRKTELAGALRAIPFLSATIRSFDDLKSASNPGVQVAAAQQQSAVARVSPLEHYLVRHGRGRDDLSRISAGLFNDSLAIIRSSRSIEQIAFRFSTDEDLSPAAIHARDELLSRTAARLLDDLKDQQQLLDDVGIPSGPADNATGNPVAGRAGFACLAERNMVATKELISGASESGLSEESLAAELAGTILQLRTAGLDFIQSRGTTGAMSSCPEPSPKS
jgi:hypothetical protein